MSKNRMEAFSDGVMAILITILVLELKVPEYTDLSALGKLAPRFASYVMSFVYLGIYWNNHHHLLQASECISGRILWANLHLLFWLSLIPFATGWMGEHGFPSLPVALYGVVLLFSGFAYLLLSHTLIEQHGKGSALAQAIGKDGKGWFSVAAYATAIAAAFFAPAVSLGLYTLVAIVWLAPDRRIEKALNVEKC